jgi:IS605 OrfB family transposase
MWFRGDVRTTRRRRLGCGWSLVGRRLSLKRCLRFWIDEPPERCHLLWQAGDELAAAYNAMLELFETEIRSAVVSEAEAAKAAWVAWRNAAAGEKPEKPRSFTFGYQPMWRKSLMDAGKAAGPNLSDYTVRQMYQDQFCRDVSMYLQRRLWSHEHAGIRRRGTALAVGLNPSGNRWRIERTADGVFGILPMWRRSKCVLSGENDVPWRLASYDRRRNRWTLDLLDKALTAGKVGGCRCVPPRRGAPAGKRRWSLMVTVDVPVEESLRERGAPVRVAGVDLGINQFAVYSCPEAQRIEVFSGRDLREQVNRRRAKLRGVPRKRGRVIGEAIGRRQDAFCRLVARRIMDQCVRDHVTDLHFEDLSRIRDSVIDDTPDRKFMLGSFPYFKLQTYVTQAAEQAGVQVRWVNPAFTSQRCSFCGHSDPASRTGRRFKCVRCGFDRDADVNAANNIAASTKFVRAAGPDEIASLTGCDQPGAPETTGEPLEAPARSGVEVEPTQ